MAMRLMARSSREAHKMSSLCQTTRSLSFLLKSTTTLFPLTSSSLTNSPVRHMGSLGPYQSKLALIPQTEEPGGWKRKSRKQIATGKHEMIRISPRKLNEILRPIRGLSVEEALIQLKFHPRRKAIYVYNCLENTRKHAVNQFNMDYTRLVVSHLNATKGKFLKRIKYHARGRFGIMFRYYAHLTVAIKEQAPEDGETRLGIYGRSHSTILRTKQFIEAKRAAWRESHKPEDTPNGEEDRA